MRDRVIVDRLSQRRIVVEFNFRDVRPANYWLVLSPTDVSVCLKHPGYEIDILFMAELAVMYQVWFGRIRFRDALSEGRVELEGAPRLVRAFPKWFAPSPAARIVRAVETT